ncbi:hypothetical protein J2Z47_005015 [Cohnella thailandensis]|nr:hypothetical protein [Cohnella thailandensis]
MSRFTRAIRAGIEYVGPPPIILAKCKGSPMSMSGTARWTSQPYATELDATGLRCYGPRKKTAWLPALLLK